MSCKNAFTLTEFGSTIVIIGIISVMTIPNLIQNAEKQKNIALLKKAYLTFNDVTDTITEEEGRPYKWLIDSDNFYEHYKKHLVNTEECDFETNCTEQSYKSLNGYNSFKWGNLTNGKLLKLPDGIHASFIYRSNECDWYSDGSNGVCGQINVDLNGSKGPNQTGRDYFQFVLKKDGLYPAGCDYNACDADVDTDTGLGCACRVVKENDIKY